MKIMNKKLLINIINISLASFSVNALSLEASSDYYQDHNGNFIGYTTDYEYFDNFNDHALAQITRDDWNGYINKQGQIATLREELDIDHTTNDFYYQTSDCTGTRYVKLKSFFTHHDYDFETEVLKQSPTTKKIIQYTVTHEPFNIFQVGDDIFGDKGVSQSAIDANGQFICTKTRQQELKEQLEEAQKLPHGEEQDTIIERIYAEAEADPLIIGKVSDSGIDMTNRYPWMGFEIEENHSVTGYFKGADFSQNIELVDIDPPEPPTELFPRTSHNITAHVRYNGDLSYVNITQGPNIGVDQISVDIKSKGVYDITFPENYLPKDGDINMTQLLCSVNSSADVYAANTTIGCHRIKNTNIIRITTNMKGNPFNSDFSLNLQR